jgi:hypothetical protein
MMLHTLSPSLKNVPAGALADLRASGIRDEDILTAFQFQENQRQAGARILPLRVICGLEPATREARSSFSATASRLLGTKPKAQARRGGIHITQRPVRAGSVRTGDVAEAEFVRPVGADQLKRMRHACHSLFTRARNLAAEQRQGKALSEDEGRLTLFTRACRDMMLKLLDELHYRKGWCIPSYETLMRWTGLKKRAVAYCINRLKSLGLLEWINRYNYASDPDFGARSEQTSNLYRCQLPERLAKLVGLHTPLPADEEARRDADLAQHADWLANAGAVERQQMMPKDKGQRAALILAGRGRHGVRLPRHRPVSAILAHLLIIISILVGLE